uniref:Uncharacterized protein n=1 Tax=Amphimedon queenslandica TaxID=400682 RepID=A0A1X7VWA2_AMPQE
TWQFNLLENNQTHKKGMDRMKRAFAFYMTVKTIYRQRTKEPSIAGPK